MGRIRPVGKRESSVSGEGSKVQDYRRWTLSGKNEKNFRISFQEEKTIRPSDFWTSDYVSKL